ncbi:MAG: nuclear transport factor 2 family protein, partial [Flavisolibacter sp.]|nr:nuclear transport factor 2 family protein [Flavisolibacter sp.]
PHTTPAFEKETKGLNAIIEKGHKFDAMTQELHHVDVSEPIVTGNAFAFKLTMDITMKERSRETWEEICVYTVKDGKIISEQFFL